MPKTTDSTPAPASTKKPRAKASEKPASADAPSKEASSAKEAPKTPSVAHAEATAVARVSRTHTKESLSAEFDLLETEMASEIERLRTVAASGKGSKAVGIKQLRTFLKSVRQLHSHAQRVTRFKRASNPAGSAPQNTGLMKPVRVTPEISSFFGWPAEQLQSRVSVTKCVWEYIKSHGLQDVNQKRYILLARDPKLCQLLRYDQKSNDNVSYCSLQKYLKIHFISEKPTEKSAGVAPAPSAPPAVATPAPALAVASAEPKRRVTAKATA